ncbi:MAG: hypothetical protein AVDCRST_MAG56-3573 [uncultured Cytophagales bacterium]|uniref:Uncharacterized protein n=1 Tax=uncultured Cytophagales bacterium TaxID=158755 RepID=A0A6J4JHA7_9SPHI|nr:MAG: hypothetical protein AVDCRST_MAG56-3573 [uncultured Cytophagales bacterium]
MHDALILYGLIGLNCSLVAAHRGNVTRHPEKNSPRNKFCGGPEAGITFVAVY